MANPSDDSPREAITCVIPVFNVAGVLEKSLNSWIEALHRLRRDYEILLVNDGSTDATAESAHKFTDRLPQVRLLTHDSRRGYGACLRTALAEARHPLFFYTSLDESYAAGDLKSLLERIEVNDEILDQAPVVVSGCRVGQPKPRLVRLLGSVWRAFCRIVLGLPVPASPAWLGFREAAYSYIVWVVFSVPMIDPTSAFKLWRTDFLRRFPIQSDSDFVHVELVAKATFLTQILDEIPLTPRSSPGLTPRRASADFWRVLRNPDFGRPLTTPASVS